ncbi:MAG TPA: hypothetical protein VKG05_10990 [Steroidobacteraceae bacterium]|nr:hypothetical protein [Steroidobacteraceae bacterium]
MAGVFQIDRRSAFGAADLADFLANFLEFHFGQAADELLFPQELKERRVTPVSPQTAEIRKLAGLAYIEADRKRIPASRAAQPLCHRLSRVIQVGLDFLEQFDDRGGRELHASQVIEPDSGAGEAQIRPHGPVINMFESLRLHRLLAVWAGYRGQCIDVGHRVITRQQAMGI